MYYVGRGKKASPGEPSESQDIQDQEAFQTSLKTGSPVEILAKLKTGLVIGLGQYRVASIRRVPGFRDIDFYQILLLRMRHS